MVLNLDNMYHIAPTKECKIPQGIKDIVNKNMRFHATGRPFNSVQLNTRKEASSIMSFPPPCIPQRFEKGK